MIATAESCTGGMVAVALSDLPGSSDVFAGGFVTYSNAMKTAVLGVPAGLIATHGAVSEPVAREPEPALSLSVRRRNTEELVDTLGGFCIAVFHHWLL